MIVHSLKLRGTDVPKFSSILAVVVFLTGVQLTPTAHTLFCAPLRSVEDMMKRSFSEFRTQRELGAKDLPKLMIKCTDALAKLDDQAKVTDV